VQGGVSSPVRAKVFLQQVVAEWCEREGRPRLKGRAFLRRGADDVCIGCELAGDARQIRAVRPTRCARVGVTMHPEQTAWLAVGTPAARQAWATGKGTGAFLGLPQYGATSRRGLGVLTRRTARTRLQRPQQSRWRGCRTTRHAPVPDQDRMRCLKRRGPCRSYGSRGHVRLREDVRRDAEQAWCAWRSRRRSHRAMGWAPCPRLLQT
jgi:RNA-directed DNA polymerase